MCFADDEEKEEDGIAKKNDDDGVKNKKTKEEEEEIGTTSGIEKEELKMDVDLDGFLRRSLYRTRSTL